ncbi:Uma2 family endonuclease [Gloeobacter morelensis]|uniref:Uma2 family endonuclease n=1 Tax=Gloeobacter morelensis MG652769 TaxID=2781736 RepID=A0ABY3PNV4_9CYAN|nr:Uma2 family endonuclease [Gloeobacter morelensis MG652769]
MTGTLKTHTYPSGDGLPVAETFLHVYAILITLEVLKQYLEGTRATVLANQFLYYAPDFPTLRVAPDVMVIFGVEPGGRDNYKTWEEGQVPSVIFEITSKHTQSKDQGEKKTLYAGLGVQEYWLFDPKGEWIAEQLQGYRLRSFEEESETISRYVPIADGTSEPLGLQLVVEGALIGFYRLDTGDKLLIPAELAARLKQEQLRAEQAERRAELAERRAAALTERLRALGVDPDQP